MAHPSAVASGLAHFESAETCKGVAAPGELSGALTGAPDADGFGSVLGGVATLLPRPNLSIPGFEYQAPCAVFTEGALLGVLEDAEGLGRVVVAHHVGRVEHVA